ncbi:ribosome biogenesis protein Ssf2 [Apiospora arundinis]
MASLLSYVPIVNRFVGSSAGAIKSIDLPPVKVHELESSPEKRTRTLKHLLKANHINHSVIYGPNNFHNHTPHILGSAYILGANEQQQHKIYEEEIKELDPWKPSPAEVTEGDWRDFLGDIKYQRAYLDFFEDNLANKDSYEWKKVVQRFMFEGEEPLVNCLISGLGHPLIHLGYAFELDSRQIGMEALVMTSVSYSFLHKYLDDPSYTKPSASSSTSPRELLEKMRNDKRLDGMFEKPSLDNFDTLFEKHEDIFLEYWNAWTFEDPVKQFQDSQEAAVAFLVGSVPPGAHSYNFFICHILTTSHAVRILLPIVPKKFHISLVRQWWLLTVALYMILNRPKIDFDDYVRPGDLKGKKWNYVVDKALNGPYSTDAHVVKAVRAMKEAAETWGDANERYLAAAVKFVDEFRGWEFD